jgi:hypothetical protein
MSKIAQRFMFKQQYNMRKEYTKMINDFSPGSWVLLLQILLQWCSSSSFLLGIYSPVSWEMFWDNGVLKSANSNEKTALKLQVRASSPENYGPQFLKFLIRGNQRANPIIAVRNLIISVHNFCPEVLFTWFLRVGSIHLVPRIISHVDILVYIP